MIRRSTAESEKPWNDGNSEIPCYSDQENASGIRGKTVTTRFFTICTTFRVKSVPCWINELGIWCWPRPTARASP
jgi:hypothetical protein